MSQAHIIERLQHLGMSGYEAKSYIALVGAGIPLNGYEVAKRSGVPRSTVYETLGKLVNRGAAFEVKPQGEGNGVEYLPLPPRVLVDRLTKEYNDSIAELERALPAITSPPQVRLIHDLNGHDALLDRAAQVIDGTRREVFISAWDTDWERLHTPLSEADRRGVDVSAVHFGEVTDPVGHSYQHILSSPDVVLENLGCRMLTVVGDREEAVIGGLTDTGAWGVYTDNPAVVLLSVEFIRHDIAIQLMATKFADAGLADFWSTNPDLQRLRSDFGISAQTLQSP